MIRSRRELEEASEDVFCEEFLIPLLRSMGFNDVVFHHGGPLEQGKDVVMWKPGDFSPRVNYAVVAKAQRIVGNVSIQSEVLHQIKQALATDFPDATTAESQRATRVLVASNRDITKEALTAIGPLMDREGLAGRVEFLGSDRLWELAEKHLMPWLIADSLARTRAELLKIDPDYRVDVSLTAEGVSYTILPKHEDAPQITLSTTPDFPPNEEGERLRTAFAEFIRTGGVLSVENAELPLVGPPAILRLLMPSSVEGPVEIFMPPRAPNDVMIWRLIAKSGDHEAEIPYVHFTTLRGGLVKMSFTNEDQPLPLFIELGVDKETWECRLSYTLRHENVPLCWFLLYCEFLSTLAEGATIEVEDVYDGIRSTLIRTEVGEVSAPPASLLDLLRRAHAIEERTRQAILVRDIRNISDGAVRGVAFAEEILNTGKISGEWVAVNVSFAPDMKVLRDLLALSKRGGAPVQLSQRSQTVPVLGSPIDFGPSKVTFEKAVIHEEDVPGVEQSVATGTQNEVPFRFVCAPGTQAEVVFERWQPSS